MYKIYNNEIKITQNLKGGATTATAISKADDISTIFSSNKKFNKKESILTKKDVKHVVPLDGVSIDFKNLNQDMVNAIERDIEKLHNVFFEDGADVFTAGNYQIFDDKTNLNLIAAATVKEISDQFNKNILRYAMSWAKEIELYDYENKGLLSYENYMKKLFGGDGKTQPTKSGAHAVSLFTLLNNTTSGAGQKATQFKAIIDGINKLLSIKEYKIVPDECNKWYPKIVSNHSLPHWMGFGGGYDNLKYSLDGGVLSTLIRVPDLAKHYKAQLSVLESKLKMSNKTLSSVSKNKINTVIDQLEKHENFLKDTFELLRNSPLIDENKVDFEAHETKLKRMEKYAEILAIKKMGITLTKSYDINSDYDEMCFEVKFWKDYQCKKDGVEMAKGFLVNAVQGLEFLNESYDPFGLKLGGWSEQIELGKDSYTSVFEELYDKYKISGRKIQPEIKLVLMMSASAASFHASKKMAESIPGLDSVLSNNPELLSKLQNSINNNISSQGKPVETEEDKQKKMYEQMQKIKEQQSKIDELKKQQESVNNNTEKIKEQMSMLNTNKVEEVKPDISNILNKIKAQNAARKADEVLNNQLSDSSEKESEVTESVVTGESETKKKRGRKAKTSISITT